MGALLRIAPFLLAAHIACAQAPIGAHVLIYATQSGRPALDDGDGGGNPFAGALIETLQAPRSTQQDFATALRSKTLGKSAGFQSPEVSGEEQSLRWMLSPAAKGEKRLALILAYSSYTRPIPALAGADLDARRISDALRQAGFEVKTVVDPDRNWRERELASFTARSGEASIALIYATGHGVEIGGETFLIPIDYPFAAKAAGLASQAVRVKGLGLNLRASKLNLILFGGCRDNPQRW